MSAQLYIGFVATHPSSCDATLICIHVNLVHSNVVTRAVYAYAHSLCHAPLMYEHAHGRFLHVMFINTTYIHIYIPCYLTIDIIYDISLSQLLIKRMGEGVVSLIY